MKVSTGGYCSTSVLARRDLSTTSRPACARPFQTVSRSDLLAPHRTRLYTTDGGLNWELATGERRALSDYLSDAQCFSRTTCYAVDGFTRIVTTDAGRVWSIDTAQWNAEAACPSARTCLLPGFDSPSKSGVIEVTTDGGESWRTAVELPVGFGPTNMSCGTGGLCAVGLSSVGGSVKPEIAVTTDYGARWSFLEYS